MEEIVARFDLEVNQAGTTKALDSLENFTHSLVVELIQQVC